MVDVNARGATAIPLLYMPERVSEANFLRFSRPCCYKGRTLNAGVPLHESAKVPASPAAPYIGNALHCGRGRRSRRFAASAFSKGQNPVHRQSGPASADARAEYAASRAEEAGFFLYPAHQIGIRICVLGAAGIR